MCTTNNNDTNNNDLTNNSTTSVCGWCGVACSDNFCSTTCESECMDAYNEDMANMNEGMFCRAPAEVLREYHDHDVCELCMTVYIIELIHYVDGTTSFANTPCKCDPLP